MVDAAALDAVAAAVDPKQVVHFAQTLIGTPSENPGGTEDEVAEVVEGLLVALGATSRIVRGEAGRPSVVARIGDGGSPRLAWNGHLDVVPVGDPETWEYPPFGGEIVDGRLIGRGAADMKGAIASAFAAVAALGRSSVELGGTLDLHLVADEEMAGYHGTQVLLEQGLLDQDAAIVGEATSLDLGLAERGGAWVVATARGRSAHGSRPHLGVNAITTMSRFLLRIHEVLPDLEHPLAGRPTVNAATIEGGSAPNVVADRCVVDIDRRTIPGERSQEEVLEPFERLAASIRDEDPDADLSFELRMWLDAAEADPAWPISERCRSAIEGVLGRPSQDVGFTGITDARYYLNEAKIPTVLLGPGTLAIAHTANEWVEVDELVAAARIYARVFADILAPS